MVIMEIKMRTTSDFASALREGRSQPLVVNFHSIGEPFRLRERLSRLCGGREGFTYCDVSTRIDLLIRKN
jgi:hypothetical protein